MPPGYSADNAKGQKGNKSAFSKQMTYEEFYGITDFSSAPPGFEEKKQTKVSSVPEEKQTKLVPEEKKQPKVSFLPEQPKKQPNPVPNEEEDWVTVKPKPKHKSKSEAVIKKLPPSQKFETFVEMQLSTNKTNKKKAIKKKLKEIKELQQKQKNGEKLNPQQLEKIQNKEKLEKELISLG